MKTLILEFISNIFSELSTCIAGLITEKTAKYFSHFFALGVALVFFSLMILFVSCACVLLMSELLNSWFWGFIVMGGINLLLIFICMPLARAIGKRFFLRYFKK